MKKLFASKTFIFTILLLFLLGGLFCWFAYRPAKIRHDCSWVKRVNPAIPARPAITKEDVEESKLKYDECVKETGDNFIVNFSCENLLKKEGPAIPAKPETEWYEEAGQYEYDFCIHEKGLRE